MFIDSNILINSNMFAASRTKQNLEKLAYVGAACAYPIRETK